MATYNHNNSRNNGSDASEDMSQKKGAKRAAYIFAQYMLYKVKSKYSITAPLETGDDSATVLIGLKKRQRKNDGTGIEAALHFEGELPVTVIIETENSIMASDLETRTKKCFEDFAEVPLKEEIPKSYQRPDKRIINEEAVDYAQSQY